MKRVKITKPINSDKELKSKPEKSGKRKSVKNRKRRLDDPSADRPSVMKPVMLRLRGKMAHVDDHGSVNVARDDLHLLIRYAEEFEKLAALWDHAVPKTQDVVMASD